MLQNFSLMDGAFLSAKNSGQDQDPYFSSVSLLLHMDGANGSTTFVDSSANAFSVSKFGDARITSISRFGSGALILEGSYDYLTTPASPAFQLGTGNFTVECWVYVDPGNVNNGLFTFGGTSTGLAVSLYYERWYLTTTGGGNFLMGSAALNTWQHLAVARSGNSLRMFINGAQIGSTVSDVTDLFDNMLKIGYYYTPEFAFKGKVDEFRVTKGVARYTADFTPPTEPFPDF